MPVIPSTTGYVDVEQVLTDWLKATLGYQNAVHETPPNLTYLLPCVVVQRFGGNDPTITIDVANVDVDVYAPDRATALAHAETIRQALRTRLVGYTHGGALVTKVATLSAPTHATWDSRVQVRRYTAAYQITIHKFTGV